MFISLADNYTKAGDTEMALSGWFEMEVRALDIHQAVRDVG